MRPGLIALGVAVLAALAGCGSDSGSSSGGTALERSLGSVKAGAASKAYVEWGDTARLADLAHLPPDGGGSSPDDRFLRVAGAGFGNLGTTSDQLPKLLGIHPFGADTAITVGTPPRVATRLAGSGLAASAAEAKLRAAGAKPTTVGGRELLALGEEGNAGTDRLDDFGLGLGRDFDRVAIGSDSIATGAYAEPVLELMGGAPSLGDDPTYAAGASCLGDVSYAILSTAIEDSHLADIPGSPALVAIGGRISPAKAVDEVVCVVYGSDAAAKSEADGLRKSLVPGALLPSTRERLSGPVAKTTVDTVGAGGQSAARAVLSLKPGTPPSLVISAFYRGDLTALLGGPGRGPVGP